MLYLIKQFFLTTNRFEKTGNFGLKVMWSRNCTGPIRTKNTPISTLLEIRSF